MRKVKENISNEESCIMRFGYVSDYDEFKHRARVRFPDKDNMISGWLPVGVRNTKKNKDIAPLDIGEHVCCFLSGSGTEDGIILCSFYDDNNEVPEINQDIRCVHFSDGTIMRYDREDNSLDILNKEGSYILMKRGVIHLHAAQRLSLTAPRIDLN